VIQETVHRILAGKCPAFLALEQSKPVLLMEQEDENKAK